MAEVFVDRIEGKWAVLLLDEQELRLPRALLPEGAGEGDVLRLALTLDPQATRAAKARVDAARKKLSQDDDGGDFSL